MSQISPRNVAEAFNLAITARNLSGLGELMTEDHTLITGTEQPVKGKAACLSAWRRFFEMVSDYRNVFEKVWSEGQVVRMSGRSLSADDRLNGPAIWKAVVEGGRIREWHVHEDTPEARQRLGHDPENPETGTG